MSIPPPVYIIDNQQYIKIIHLLILLCLLSLGACGRKSSPVDEDEEVRIFSLVADPSAAAEYPVAIARADSILKNVEITDTLRAYIMLERSTAMLMNGQMDAGKAFTDTVITFASAVGLPDVEAQALQNKGIAYRRAGNYTDAIKCYSRSVDIAIATSDKELEQTATELLAICYVENGRLPEGQKFALRSLQLADDIGDPDAHTSSVATLAAAYVREERYQDVLSLILPQLQKLDGVNPVNVIKILTPAAQAATRLDSVGLAERIVGEMKEISSVYPPETQISVVTLSAESALAAMKGDYPRQWALLCRLDSLPSHGRSEVEMAKERSACLFNLGRYKEAYGVLETALDSLESDSYSRIQDSFSEFSVRYDTALKDLEIERLKTHRLILAVTAVSCIAALLIGFLLWRFLSRLRRDRQIRMAQMEFIRGLEHERARLARELHDDIAGHLVGIQYDILTLSREECGEKITSVARKVRDLSHDLMPPEFRQLSLPQLLKGMANNSSDRCVVTVTEEGSYPWEKLAPKQSMELYRIVQEVINNAVKHSSEPSVSIRISGSDNRYLLQVESAIGKRNNTPADTTPGVGHRIMEIRASLAGASLAMEKTNSKYNYIIREI